jgi:glycosidase
MTKQERQWWQTGVIYQIYPRSYRDTTGNGVGDLPGIIQKLDYFQETLPVDAIWLSPFYPSPMKDFGYDVADYQDVDPLFGTLEDFRELLKAAHGRSIRVIIDLVPNHSSDQHAWFQESRSSRNNPKRDWYIWADPKPDGSPPNNWLSVFGGPAWEWDGKTEQYYLHSFLKEQPDLNWRNPEVQEAMFDVARFWLEMGVDGFRIDVAHYIMKDPDMRDNPLNQAGTSSIHRPLGEYDSQFHLYDKGHPDNHDIYRRFRQVLDAYSEETPRVSIGEIHIVDWEEWAAYYGDPSAPRGSGKAEIHMPFNFSLLGVTWTAEAVREKVDQLEAVLPEGGWPNYVLGNHDEQRLVSRIGRDQARVAAMLLLTLRGTPTLYYGEEIGLENVDIPPEDQKDPFGLQQPGQGRDQCRTPMQWDDSPKAGFSDPDTPSLWLPLADNFQTINVEAQKNDPRSLLSLYQQLLTLRKEESALQIGGYRPLDSGPDETYLYLRETDRDRLLIALNFSSDAKELPADLAPQAEILLSTYLDQQQTSHFPYALRPQEGIIFRLP